MKRVLCAVMAGLALAGCAPRASQTQAALPVTPLGEPEYRALIAPFSEDLQALGVQVERASVYRYTGTAPDAFAQATREFYQRYPGFCPLQGGFFAAENRPVFLTLAARGTEIRGFVYDQAERPRLPFAYFEGRSRETLGPAVCPPREGR
ncbi:hypothetical protein ACTQ9L_15145 [Deinococcus wulumuqiensis]|nr:hypothetical protein [Deinococcus wulumuqiensis]